MIEIHHFLITPCELFPKFTTKVGREGAWIVWERVQKEEVAEKGILYIYCIIIIIIIIYISYILKYIYIYIELYLGILLFILSLHNDLVWLGIWSS